MKNIIILFVIVLASFGSSHAQNMGYIQDPTPTIVADPSNAATCLNNNTSFTVNANVPGGLTYQWKVDPGTGVTTVVDNATYSGANLTTLNITAAGAALNNYKYSVVVTSIIGSCSATSNFGTLTVNPLPIITVQPANVSVCENGTQSIVITDNAATHQWQLNVLGIWTNVVDDLVHNGATTNTLTVLSATNAMNNNQYRCISTSALGCITTSSTATLTVNPLPIITVQPANVSVCENGTQSIVITDNAATHQWQLNVLGVWTNVVNGAVYAGATTNTLTVLSATNAMNNNQYRCVSTSAAGCVTNSNASILTVNPLAIFTLQPANATVCELSNTSFNATANAVGGVTYQWKSNAGGAGFVNLIDNATFNGSATNSLAISGAAFATNGSSFIVVATTTIGGCSVNSAQVVLTVNPLPTVPGVLINGKAFALNQGNGCDATAIYTLTTSQLNYSYQLQDQVTSANIGAPIIGTGNAISFPAQPEGKYKNQTTSVVGCVR